jgi:pullulanase
MDVVYNHTGKSADSNFNLILPGYYYRMNDAGGFSNGSGTGNETASERAMVRKYMVDSTVFWASEYNIDGFRFDLMKLHDVDTMNAIVAALHAIDPTIMVYGEPWTGGTSPLPSVDAAYKDTLNQMPGVGIFNDSLRDAIKGSVFDGAAPAFVQGDNARDSIIVNGVLGEGSPSQTVNYVTAHDNNTLYDKLRLSTTDLSIEALTKMQEQSYAIVLLSQGISFLHGGVEIMRTKPCAEDGTRDTCDFYLRYDHNSYKSPDSTNQIDWQWKVDHYDTFLYYQSLIKLRLMKDVLRLTTNADVQDQVNIIADDVRGLVSYTLLDPNDTWKEMLIVFNNGSAGRNYTLPEGTWHLIANHENTITWTGDEPDVIGSPFNGGSDYYLNPNDTLIFYSTE